jgi:hypothetical protein
VASVFVSLALLPLLDSIAPRLAHTIGGPITRSLPGTYVVGRSWFWVLLGMVVVGMSYHAIRTGSFPLGRPRGNLRLAVSLAVLAPLGVLASLVVLVGVGLGASVATAADAAAIPLSPVIAYRTALIGLCVGLGYGVLVHGALHAHVRERVGPGAAVAATTVLAGLYHWQVDPMTTLSRSVAHSLVGIVLIVGTGATVAVLSRHRRHQPPATTLSPGHLVVFALAGLLAFGLLVDLLSGATSPAELLVASAWLVVFGVAARVREQTESIWPAVVGIGLFQIGMLLLPTTEIALGLVPG